MTTNEKPWDQFDAAVRAARAIISPVVRRKAMEGISLTYNVHMTDVEIAVEGEGEKE